MLTGKSIKSIVLLLSIIILAGCNKTAPNFEELTQEWNEAHVSKDVGELSKLYNDTVLFYGTMLDKNSCIEKKLALFNKNTDFIQKIEGVIQIEELSTTIVKCSFVKQVTINGKTNDYPSYLIFEKTENGWRIVTESDLITDSNLSVARVDRTAPANAVKGDFDGDGKTEYMWVIKPEITEDGMDCVDGRCILKIRFSDPNIPDIVVDQSIDGDPDNLGDLNQNGTDEVGIQKQWFTSCWSTYLAWTLKEGKWIAAVDPITTHCMQFEQNKFPIQADRKKAGYALIHYCDISSDDLKVLTKSEEVAK